MRNILEVVTFFTPIDKREEVEMKEKSIDDMIATAMQNSGENFQRNNREDPIYQSTIYSIDGMIISIDIKKDEYMSDYYSPHMALKVSLHDAYFEKSNVESFLNTVLRFFSGMYKEDYFISYDNQYAIIAMNTGKKYSVENIKSIDTNSIFSEKNKILLDSLLYLHYTLQRGVEDIDNVGINNSIIQGVDKGLGHSVHLAGIRKNQTRESLVKNLSILHSQIEITFTYFL